MLPKRPGFECSRDQNSLALLFWRFEDGKVFSFGIGVDKSCKLTNDNSMKEKFIMILKR